METVTTQHHSNDIEVIAYSTIFVPWTRNTTSVHFDDKVTYAPYDAQTEAMIVHKPLVARPNLTWSDILNVLDVRSRQISQVLEKLERGLDAVHICAERFINPNQIVDIILGIPKWIKAALIVLCTFATITLGLWIKHVITKFMKCCKQKPKRTVAISDKMPTLN